MRTRVYSNYFSSVQISNFINEINLNGYNIKKIDDKLFINFSTYQTNQNDDDNSSLPTVFPYIIYDSGSYTYKSINYENQFEFYNIFRDKKPSNYAKEQQKLSNILSFSKNYLNFNSNIIFEGQLYNQFYNTIKKDIESSRVYSGNIFRTFPIAGIRIDTPFKLNKNIFDIESGKIMIKATTVSKDFLFLLSTADAFFSDGI